MSTATATAETAAPRVRVLGKTIKLAADYDPAGKDSNTVIRTSIPFSMKSLNDEDRTIEFIGSTATHDRYNDTIVQTGWELGNFVKNPVIPWGHDYSQPPVAKALEVGLREGNLFFKGQWATAEEYPYADTIYKLYKGGYLRAFSVGFIPLEWELKQDEEHGMYFVFTKCELLEVSCVTVPANPEALTLAFSEGVLSDSERRGMVKQAEKLISSLTDDSVSAINEGMNDETKAYIDDKFKTVLDAIAELKAAPAEQDDVPVEDEDETPEPAATPDGGSNADEDAEPSEDAVRKMFREGLHEAAGIID